MPALDGLKEQLIYLRLRVGIIVVAELSLVGWLASAPETATIRLLSLGTAGMMALAVGIFLLHRQVIRCITEIRNL